MQRYVEVQGVRVPTMIYGTAWKEERTAELTAAALEAGFRGIDTANQRRHYFEAAVGQAVQEAIRSGVVKREDLFLQTKFTYRAGQDHRLPYDPAAPLAQQVEQSMASSLEHFGVDHLDAYLLHGPSFMAGWQETDRETWRAMEELHRRGKTRLLGVSNVSIDQLQSLHAEARVKPSIVQNRCFTRAQADEEVRRFCKSKGIVYEGFSLLTAIAPVLQHPTVQKVARRVARSPAEIIFRYALERGMVVLTGTTSVEHMRQDLTVYGFDLGDDEVAAIGALVGEARNRA